MDPRNPENGLHDPQEGPRRRRGSISRKKKKMKVEINLIFLCYYIKIHLNKQSINQKFRNPKIHKPKIGLPPLIIVAAV